MFRLRAPVGVAIVLLVSGCQMTTADLVSQGKPIEKIYPVKSGVTIDRYNDDILNCEVEAANRVPQNMSVGTTPVYRTPVRTHCYSTGYGGVNCTQTGGQTYGGHAYSYDANAGLRVRAQQQCLERLGYRVATIPKCPPNAKVRPVSTKLPPLSAGTCYVAYDKGEYDITEQVK